jgi:eukaryotic-like serine/threonine-protein kinase
VGSVLDGRLRLVEPIAVGVPGAVWRAVDEDSGREVAVKTLPAYQVGDAVAQARFRLVARAVMQLSHPAIAQVYEYGERDLGAGIMVPYVVRELVPGQTLQQRLGEGPLLAAEALRILGTVADALAVAHRAGAVHGNIEPANIVLGPAGVKVTDFGLAALREPVPGAPGAGPLAYPAPELASGGPASAAADMYSLGVVFVACLTGIAGRAPGAGTHGSGATDPVPASLGALWAACLGANPQDRPSAAHVAVMSRQIPAGRPQEVADSEADAESWVAAGPGAAAGSGVAAASGAAAGSGAAPDSAAPPTAARPALGPGRGRAPRWRRGRVVLVGGAVAALAAGVVALTQLPSSSVSRLTGPAADSTTVSRAGSPRPSESVSTSVRTATPVRTSPVLGSASASASTSASTSVPASASAMTPTEAIGALSATVLRGEATGQIRPDAGVDFENFIRPVEADLVAGRPADVPQLVTTLRAKLKQRESEGAVSPAIDRVMSSELDALLASASH